MDVQYGVYTKYLKWIFNLLNFTGQHQDEIDQDIAQFKKLVERFISPSALLCTFPEDYLHEFVRSGFSELYSIASFMGGICSQECIKLLTKQYVPFSHTLIYDGIQSTCHLIS